MRKQNGFTLIELIVVIVILGILAATAMPRFIDMEGRARMAALNGLAGAMRSAASLAQGNYLAVSNLAATTVPMGVGAAAINVDVVVGTGFPQASATGIQAALQDSTGFVFAHAGGVTTVTQTGGPAACAVTYTQATGVVNSAAITAANCPS